MAEVDMGIHTKVTRISSDFISTDFHRVPVELYFIKGERNAIIDTGTSQSPHKDIPRVLSALGLRLADIDLILNTHGHFDHTGGNAAVKAASNARVLIHRDDIVMVEDPQCYFDQWFAPAVEAIRGKEHLDEERANLLKRGGEKVTVDRQLQDNDLIDLGNSIELRAIHLPGHTSGSVGFYWEKEGILFSGDSLPGLHTEGGNLPVIWDLPRYEESLERLKEIPIRILLHAHHYRGLTLPPNPARQIEEVNQYLQDCREVASQIGEAIRHVAPYYAPGKNFMEIANKVACELPEEMGFTTPMHKQALYCVMTVFLYLSQVR